MEDTKKCIYCQSEISKKAVSCPNCRKKQKKPINSKLLITMFLLIGILVILGSISDDNSLNTEITSGNCSGEMRQEVANEYKSPSTVEFINCEWDKSKGIYGEANAQNGFGAIVRSTFLCNGNSCIITEK